MYPIQHYVIKYISDLPQVCGFLLVLRFPPPIKNNHHDIAKILLKVALNTITLTLTPFSLWSFASCWIVGIFFYYLIICLMGQNPFCWHYCRITHMNYNEWVSDVCLTLNWWFRSYIMSRASHMLMRWWWCPLFCTSPTCLVRFFNSASSLK